MFFRSIATLACTAVLATASLTAQMPDRMNDMPAPASAKPLLSPAAIAKVTLSGKQIVIHYNAPSLRGRKMIGGEDPYGKVWRTGANPATTLITKANLKVGTLDVAAGTYTIYTLPSPDTWLLIINKQTGQWGTVYNENQDLGRTPMKSKTLPASQEKMSISFEHTKRNSTELHVKWGTIDEYVNVTAE
ncbi:MAG TPA: DUF2911 domain-containing protein [Edaphobacter sp.]|uniref:DUF2911 domain-containing protein n=1 Tax=Edaphobacter sp. TaxID=1934404 RepID=UPI002BD40446|nr:DUF2911 domain-containing protein [Edaphobacter sp.]HUZ95899.1 DUF2911 domain-containing protein [Edaphobacter sp.]